MSEDCHSSTIDLLPLRGLLGPVTYGVVVFSVLVLGLTAETHKSSVRPLLDLPPRS